MKFLLNTFFLILSVAAMSQPFPRQYVDSLTAVALSRKSTHPMKLNQDSMVKQLFIASSPAERIAVFYDVIANSEQLTQERLRAFHELILNGAQKRGDKVLEATVLAELGFIIARNGNTADGLKMIYQSLEKAEATGNAQAMGIAYNNLGNCYPNNKQLSRDYWLKALEYSRKANDHLFVCFDLGNLGGMYRQAKKMDSALACFLEDYRLAVEKNLEPTMPNVLLQLSRLDDPKNSLHYYRQVALMPYATRNSTMKNNIAYHTATYYIQRKIMDSAFYFASAVYEHSKTANSISQLNALNLMSTYYGALNKPDSTLSYLSRYYKLKDSLQGGKAMEQAQAMAFNDMQRQKELVAQKAAFQNRMIVYFLSAVAILLMGLAFIFWRSKKKEQQAKKMAQEQRDQLEQTLGKLKTTQSQLIQSEKMASLGELTAGIAHEIQNPLNFVNNFSELNKELLVELKDEIDKGNLPGVKTIANDIIGNEEKINHHGKRADAIVKGMLQHSQSSNGQKEPININSLADEYLRLAYHGLRAKDKSFNVSIKTDFDTSISTVNIIPQDMGRVILNLITNAFYVVDEKKKQTSVGYDPVVSVSTRKNNGKIEISVKDNGNGIPQRIVDKIFQPFFTTKPTGQGTGLGLSLSYDIVKAHGGELKVETKEGVGSEFIISIPV